jgi:UDP-N-acetylmuramate dehydrogenase
MVFGNGSNTLVRDKGIRGMVISLAKFDRIEAMPKNEERRTTNVIAGAGVSLQKLVGWSIENALSGLEPLTGIPGTVGGAIVMNAGTKDGSIGGVVEGLKVFSKGRMTRLAKTGLEFSYRKLKLPRNAVIVEAELALKEGVSAAIEEKVEAIRHKRREGQPLIWPSLGSVFKNPPHARRAWQLIDECDLRNVRVGGARISAEHANWIVNENNASAKDVEVLINMIKEQVKERFNINLETEIAIAGE